MDINRNLERRLRRNISIATAMVAVVAGVAGEIAGLVFGLVMAFAKLDGHALWWSTGAFGLPNAAVGFSFMGAMWLSVWIMVLSRDPPIGYTLHPRPELDPKQRAENFGHAAQWSFTLAVLGLAGGLLVGFLGISIVAGFVHTYQITETEVVFLIDQTGYFGLPIVAEVLALAGILAGALTGVLFSLWSPPSESGIKPSSPVLPWIPPGTYQGEGAQFWRSSETTDKRGVRE